MSAKYVARFKGEGYEAGHADKILVKDDGSCRVWCDWDESYVPFNSLDHLRSVPGYSPEYCDIVQEDW